MNNCTLQMRSCWCEVEKRSTRGIAAYKVKNDGVVARQNGARSSFGGNRKLKHTGILECLFVKQTTAVCRRDSVRTNGV